MRSTSWNTEKESTPTNVRWMGEEVPGREVYNRRHLPSRAGRVVGAAGAQWWNGWRGELRRVGRSG